MYKWWGSWGTKRWSISRLEVKIGIKHSSVDFWCSTIPWCRSFMYYIAKAACYTHVKVCKDFYWQLWKENRFCFNSATISAWAHAVDTLLEKERCASYLLIKWHAAVYYPWYLCFSEETDCLNMQICSHMWTALMSRIMKFYLSNLIESIPDSNNTKEKKEFHSLCSLSLFHKRLSSECNTPGQYLNATVHRCSHTEN